MNSSYWEDAKLLVPVGSVGESEHWKVPAQNAKAHVFCGHLESFANALSTEEM